MRRHPLALAVVVVVKRTTRQSINTTTATSTAAGWPASASASMFAKQAFFHANNNNNNCGCSRLSSSMAAAAAAAAPTLSLSLTNHHQHKPAAKTFATTTRTNTNTATRIRQQQQQQQQHGHHRQTRQRQVVVSTRTTAHDDESSSLLSSSSSPLSLDSSVVVLVVVRLNKALAKLGFCSRREADTYIRRGWVTVNGVVTQNLATQVRLAPETKNSKSNSSDCNGDVIELLPVAKRIESEKRTILLHKPLGIVSCQPEVGKIPAIQLLTRENQFHSAASFQRQRKNNTKNNNTHPYDNDDDNDEPRRLSSLSAAAAASWATAGRLDVNSTGLLVLTQSGRIVQEIIAPDSNVEKEYLVRIAQRLLPLDNGSPNTNNNNDCNSNSNHDNLLEPNNNNKNNNIHDTKNQKKENNDAFQKVGSRVFRVTGNNSNSSRNAMHGNKNNDTEQKLQQLRHGIYDVVLEYDKNNDKENGRTTEFLTAKQVTVLNENQLKFVLESGKHHHIRRMCRAVGWDVIALKRVRIGKIALGNLPVGKWRFLQPHEHFT